MMAFKTLLAGGIAAAALISAAPASAQYYPGYGGGYGGGYGYNSGGGVIGAVVNSVLGGNYGGYGYNGYNANSQVSVQRCAAVVQQRIGASYGGAYGYNGGSYGGGYGYNGGGYGAGGRVVAVTSVEQRPNGSYKVKGLATSTGYSQAPDLTFGCKVDFRGNITDLNVDRNNSYGYGYNNGYNNGYPNGYSNGYSSPYGYRRY